MLLHLCTLTGSASLCWLLSAVINSISNGGENSTNPYPCLAKCFEDNMIIRPFSKITVFDSPLRYTIFLAVSYWPSSQYRFIPLEHSLS